jgi:hypothetical protein
MACCTLESAALHMWAEHAEVWHDQEEQSREMEHDK